MRIERLSQREGRRRWRNNCKVRARKLSICLTTTRTDFRHRPNSVGFHRLQSGRLESLMLSYGRLHAGASYCRIRADRVLCNLDGEPGSHAPGFMEPVRRLSIVCRPLPTLASRCIITVCCKAATEYSSKHSNNVCGIRIMFFAYLLLYFCL